MPNVRVPMAEVICDLTMPSLAEALQLKTAIQSGVIQNVACYGPVTQKAGTAMFTTALDLTSPLVAPSQLWMF